MNRTKVVIALSFLVALTFVALFAGKLAPYPLHSKNLSEQLAVPSASHWLGQNHHGEDLLTIVIYGARVSLVVGVVTTAVSMVVGSCLGLLGGYWGGRIDTLLVALIDIVLAFPGMLLAIAIAAVMGPSLFNVILALTAGGWVSFARLVRAQTLSLRERDFVTAARTLGASNHRIVLRHVLPNLWGSLLVQASFAVASAILVESSLSFLGLGVPADVPSWGSAVNDGTRYLLSAPHLATFPGIAIMLTVFSLNFLGRWTQRRSFMKDKKPKLPIGQLIMIGVEGPTLSRAEKEFLSSVQPAGVIYFRRNVKNPKQLIALSKSIRRLIGPALIGIDQEGGRVARLGTPFTLFPGNDFLGRHYAKSGSVRLASQQASAMATELKAIGVNLNFTPVADVHSNPRNPIIGPRAFSSDAKEVAKLVSATIKAYEQARVACCAKHFPGHGDSFSDSHKALPVVRASKRTLLKRELVPFKAAIQSKVPTVMTAHIIYPALDKSHPATLSKSILHDLLRKKLGYLGVVISDDLEMNAIARHQSVPQAAVDAIATGVDLLLVCKSLDLAKKVFNQVEKAIQRGELNEKDVRRSIERIQKLKRRYIMGGRNKNVSLMPHRGWKKHRQLADNIRTLGN